jgi:hypothetical protein
VALAFPAVLDAELELVCCAPPLPLLALTAAWVEPDDACAAWSVEALWTTVCD